MSEPRATTDYDARRETALPHQADAREWGAAAHVAVWSAAATNRAALIAAAYCVLSLLPWVLVGALSRRSGPSVAVLALLVTLPVAGALVSAFAYVRAVPPRYAGRGVALTTLVAHGAHLSFLLLSIVYAGAAEPANRLACAGHLHRVGQSLVFYAVKHDGKYPPSLDLLIYGADTPPELFLCPSTGDLPAAGATMDDVLRDFNADARHCSFVYVPAPSADAVTGGHVVAYEHLPNHGYSGMNVLYGDGNVRWVSAAEAKRVVAEVASGHNPPRSVTSAE